MAHEYTATSIAETLTGTFCSQFRGFVSGHAFIRVTCAVRLQADSRYVQNIVLVSGC
jgi:hypothetical protein